MPRTLRNYSPFSTMSRQDTLEEQAALLLGLEVALAA
jgi:hypothetical protein